MPNRPVPELTPHRPGRTPAVAVATAMIFLVGLNLRPAITGVGPVLGVLGADLGLDRSALGLLGAVPLIAFAAISPLVHALTKRVGIDRAILTALAVLAAGVIVRSYVPGVGLWVGTTAIGAGLAIGNVLVPSLVKQDYRERVSLATGLSSMCITLAAAVSSIVAVPLTSALGWRSALAVWAVPAVVVAVLWVWRMSVLTHREAATVPELPAPGASLWRRPSTWLVTAFMGLQSTSFYTLVNWLPSIDASRGVSPETAGAHVFLFQAASIVASLTIPLLMRGRDTQTLAAIVASACIPLGVLGYALSPALTVLWVLIAGYGTGASFVVALALMALRSHSPAETTRLSGIAQSLGYLLAALGPLIVGIVAQATGGWSAPIAIMLGIGVVQLVIAVPAGMPGRRRGVAA